MSLWFVYSVWEYQNVIQDAYHFTCFEIWFWRWDVSKKCKAYLTEYFMWFSEDAVIGNCNVMRDDDVNTRKVFIET